VARGLHRSFRWVAPIVIGAVTLTGNSVSAGAAPPGSTGRPVPPAARSAGAVPVSPVASHYRPGRRLVSAPTAAPTWPTGAGQVAIGSAGMSRAGTLPIWLRAESGNPSDPAGVIRVEAATEAAAGAAGVAGPLFTARRTAPAKTAGALTVRLDYSGFAAAYGGDWASRLHLVTLPACALSTPDSPGCRTATAVRSANDSRARTLTGTATLPADGPVVLAAAAGAGGGAGDFAATALNPSGSWQAGGAAGDFTYSYPVPVPEAPGGLKPDVSLGYDSQSQDGLISSTNNQPGWVGDGWAYDPGYIERSYSSCNDNPAGPTKTLDDCWSANNTISLSLNGASTTLVRDDSTGVYHPQNDQNERVELLTGAANNTHGGEYWRITTDDGTQFYYGLNHPPGWTSGKPETNSAWTEPVFATASGQPCFSATFANSFCPDMAYRWNLDYVVDAHSDVITMFYETETNFYARGSATTANTSYVRAGHVARIQYGQRAGVVYSSTPAGQVLFTVNGRCNTAAAGCATSTLSTASAAKWPDVPFDLNCASGAACANHGPSFWSELELTGIQTQGLNGTALSNVDSVALRYRFPATGDSTSPALWLDSITRTGQTGTTPVALPPVTFAGQPLSNRVNITNGFPPITRHRLTDISTETGGTISVGYSSAACPTCAATDPSTNTSRTYPGYWTPDGQATPILDWFNKFIVTAVTETDPTGGSANDTITSTYTPVGTGAWHHNDNPTTPAGRRTWSQWRGYGGMTVSTGVSPDPVTKVQYSYLRGMDGDTLPAGGTRSVSVADSRGDPAVPDSDQYAGATYETRVFNGASQVSDQVDTPYSSGVTATHVQSGLPALRAYHLGLDNQRSYLTRVDGTLRTTEIDYSHDALGRVTKSSDLGDKASADDDVCTTTGYADNAAAGLLDLPGRIQVVSAACGVQPSLPADAISDTVSFYDQATATDTAPTVGDLTEVRQATDYAAGKPVYATMTTYTVDQYGRPTVVGDADGRRTTTAYTPATGQQPTKTVATDPVGLVTTKESEPLRGLVTKTTDAAGYSTTHSYDAMGRLSAVWLPGRATTGPADTTFAYTISNTGPAVVTTSLLTEDATTYRTSTAIYDALLRQRETQTQTPDGNRVVSDVIYNTNGQVSVTDDPYPTTGRPSGTLVQAQAGQVPSATAFLYDGANRRTTAIALLLADEQWRTRTRYDGEAITTIPPVGGTASTSFADARGNISELREYHAGVTPDPVHAVAADYDRTRYTYTPTGRPATLTDAAGNTWSRGYNLLGQETGSTNPDAGTVTSTYDHAGQLLTSTDGRGRQVTNTYDDDGRQTASYDTTGGHAPSTSNQLTARTYDTVKKGLPAITTSFSGGDTWTDSVLGYGPFGHATAVKTTLTGTDAGLLPATGLTVGYGFSTVGTPKTVTYPAFGGLPGEVVTTGLDNFGDPISLGSPLWTSVSNIGYTQLGEPQQYTMPTAGGANLSVDLTYDQQTRATTDVKVTGAAGVLDEVSYGYGNAAVSKGTGLVTSIVDNQGAGKVDTQCFGYDYADRLAAAWTATDHCAGAPATGSTGTVGGPVAPYWQSWSYDLAGNRRTQTDHDPTGATADAVTTYHYPAAGAAQPHTLGSTTATGPNATVHSATFGYDQVGDTTSITGGGPTGNQTLTWTTTGDLDTDTTAAGTTGYVYDADGNLVLRGDPGHTTVLWGDEQLVRDTASGQVSGTRYYRVGGSQVAVLSSGHATVEYLVPDRQGTDQIMVDSADQKVTRRQYLPFGAPRGQAPTGWLGDRGYTAGTEDAVTALTNLGAREYDPYTGRFLSVDPQLDGTDPESINGYDLAANDPVTDSDPTGLAVGCVDVCSVASKPGLDNTGGVTLHRPPPGPAPSPSPHRSSPKVGVSKAKIAPRIRAIFENASKCGCDPTSITFTETLQGHPECYASKDPVSCAYGMTSLTAFNTAAFERRTKIALDIAMLPAECYFQIGCLGGAIEAVRGIVTEATRPDDDDVPPGPVSAAAVPFDIAHANYAQKDYRPEFSDGGTFKNRTVPEIAEDLRSGKLTPKQVPVEVITLDGHPLIINTRSAHALEAAGIDRSKWVLRDMTRKPGIADKIRGRLRKNKLGPSGMSDPPMKGPRP
jgi:RHS repeat-associated protein